MYLSIERCVCTYIWQLKDTNLFTLVCALPVYIHWFIGMARHRLAAASSAHCHNRESCTSHQRVVRHPAQNPFTRVARPKRRSALPPAVTLGWRQQQHLPLPPPAPRNRHLLAAGPQVPGRCHRTGHGQDSCDFSQDVSLFHVVICTGEIQQAKSYMICLFVLHTTVETVTELYLSESQ